VKVEAVVDEQISLLMNLTQEYEALKSSCLSDSQLQKSLSIELSQDEMVTKVLKRQEKTAFSNPYEIAKEKEEVYEMRVTG